MRTGLPFGLYWALAWRWMIVRVFAPLDLCRNLWNGAKVHDQTLVMAAAQIFCNRNARKQSAPWRRQGSALGDGLHDTGPAFRQEETKGWEAALFKKRLFNSSCRPASMLQWAAVWLAAVHWKRLSAAVARRQTWPQYGAPHLQAPLVPFPGLFSPVGMVWV